MDQPTFTVITVCHNAQNTVLQTVESVRDQVDIDFEHLIIDGGSTDGTLSIIGSVKHPRLNVISGPDDGIYDAMNKGSCLARGRYLIFLNADDCFTSSNALSIVGSLTISNPDLICWPIKFFTGGSGSRRTGVWDPPSLYPRYAAIGLVPPHPGTAVRATRFRELQGFRTQYAIAGDFDFFCRLAKLTPSVRTSREVLVAMRIGGTSTGSIGGIVRGIRESVASATTNYGLLGLLAAFKPIYKLRQFSPRQTP
jgi:glycosyltransferase involved in cell wall biosynthesis